jgi:hypothetical protein
LKTFIEFCTDTKDRKGVLSTMPHSSCYPCTDTTEYEYADMSQQEHDDDGEYLSDVIFNSDELKKMYLSNVEDRLMRLVLN